MQKKCSEVKNRNGQQCKIIAFLKNFFLILLKSNLTLMRDTLGTIVLIYLNGNEILQENVSRNIRGKLLRIFILNEFKVTDLLVQVRKRK